MNASKEEAKKANRDCEDLALLLDDLIENEDNRDIPKRLLLRIQCFIEVAQKKLPSEAAYQREAERKAAKPKLKSSVVSNLGKRTSVSLFNATWRELATWTVCDEFGGAEYRRVLEEYIAAGCPVDVEAFIREAANRPSTVSSPV